MDLIINGESGSSVRTKLNNLVNKFNTTGITCNALGLVADDSGEALANANKLIAGLNTYVDEMFDSRIFASVRIVTRSWI